MPKKPRKIRIGSRVWNAQKEKDAADWQTQKAADQKTRSRKAKEREKTRRHDWEQDEREHDRRKAREEREESRQKKDKGTTERLGHLKILGLSAAEDDISIVNRVYKTMALKYHPDRNGSLSALEMMKLVNNAHDFLTK